ncbi:TPA: hypothetical protein ACOJ7P_002312, partial [Streptococcus pneumoniae]
FTSGDGTVQLLMSSAQFGQYKNRTGFHTVRLFCIFFNHFFYKCYDNQHQKQKYQPPESD